MANTTTVRNYIEECQTKAARLTALLELYPDLRSEIETQEATQVFLCSTAANNDATEFEIAYSCRCCSDPELYVRVFVETLHGRVYGVPHQIAIGEWDAIDYPIEDWDEVLQQHGIQDSIIDRLRARFEAQQEGHVTTEDSGDQTIHCRAG